MNLYVECTSGIGKSTLAEKNDMFVDFGDIIPYRVIILDKKKEFVENLLNIDNKIILFNTRLKFNKKSKFMFDETKRYSEIAKIETAKNYFFLNVENIAEDLKVRIKKRELKNHSFNGLKKEEINHLLFKIDSNVIKYIKFVNSLNTENKITINSIDELNNLENILLSKFEELKNAENG